MDTIGEEGEDVLVRKITEASGISSYNKQYDIDDFTCSKFKKKN